MKGKLTRISSKHRILRTDTVEGDFEYFPWKGYCFEMSAPPLDPEKDIRWIITTAVQSIDMFDDSICQFQTENSTYKLEVLDGD